MSIKVLSTLALPTLLLACVPASEKRPPAGAAGFTTEPSAAARGEPVTTADGWTVTFTKVVVQAYVNVYAVQGADLDQGFSGSNDVWLWNGSRPAEIFARELGAGPWEIGVNLMTHYGSYEDGDDPVVNVGVSPSDEARFRMTADTTAFRDPIDTTFSNNQGPNVLLALRAEKGSRVVSLDLSWTAVSTYNTTETHVRRQVRADAVDLGPLLVEPERLLLEVDDALRFGPIAAADTNKDGWVTPEELAEAPARSMPKHRPTVSEEPTHFSLEDTLAMRCGDILVVP